MSRIASVVRLGLVLAVATTAAAAQTTPAGTTPLVFTNAAVGVASTSAQKLTETFTLTGYSSLITPTATMNYGLSYKIGAVTCTGAAGNQTCTVSVTFQPTYPGGRKDAIFLMNGDTRLATVLVYGIGTAPFALLQPGVVTSPNLHTSNYVYGSVSDENGTVYLVQQGGNQILQVTSAGVVSVVPITGLLSPREIGIDGAGVMYVADQKPNSAITTFDLVQGIQGTFPWPVPNDLYIQTVTVGNEGTVYEADFSNIYVFAPGSTTATVVPISPAVTQPLYIDVDDQEDLFILGYTLNELPFGGTQKAVGTGGELFGMGIDAAETLYYEGSTPGVAEFPASNYNASEAVVDAGVSILGASVQPNGTVDVSSDLGLDIVDRSQTTIAFGNQQVGISATGQTIQLYNGGNETLTVSSVAMSGASAFTLGTATSTTCKSGKTVAPGAFCQVVLEFLSNDPGNFTGNLVFTTNSLNNTTSTSTVTFSATITGAYLVPSPASLDFGSVTDGTTSAVKTITLTNDGAGYAASAYSPASTDPAFTVTLNTCSANVALGASCQIDVTFSPTAVQPYSATGTVQVTNAGPGNAPPVSFTLAGTGAPAAPVITETGNLWFNPAQVGVAAASAQTLTATVTITGEASLITPTAKMNYGLAYKVGAVTCTGTAGNQTCSVPVTFIPNYPGGRKDALLLMNGTTRLATVLAFGVGESAMSLIQPGVITNLSNADYVYNSVVDENGTAYYETNNTIDSVTAAGVVTPLAVAGPNSNSNLSIDGAGVIYFGAAPTNTSKIVTYDTVQGIVGFLAAPVDATYFDGVASGNEGNVYIVDNDNSMLYTLKPDGTNTALALTVPAPYNIIVDTNENLLVSNGGSGGLDKITPSGVQTEVNTNSGGLGIDAAGTVYLERFAFNGTAGVGELTAPSYANAVGLADPNTNPTGNASLAPDGTVYVGNYSNLDKQDRSQGTISFGEQQANTAATPQAVQIYNGGNEALTLSNITITGEGFTLGTSTSDNCAKTGTVAAGALCNLTVGFLPTHAGVYSGTVTITSNALNNTTTTQTVALSGFVYGVYVSAAPDPLAFGSVTDGTTSAPLTVTFTNNGDLYSAGLGSFSSTDPAFVVTPGTSCSSIGVGSSCTASITFAPTAVQSYSATISYSAGSSGGGPNQNGSFTVTGAGTAAAAPAVTFSPTYLIFPATNVSTTSAVMTSTLKNTGNAVLNISGITIGGLNPSDFAQTNNCGATLAAGASCTISVTFTPATANALAAQINVADNAAGSPQGLAISGSGNGGVTANPTSLNMGSETEYTENYTPQYVTLTNNTGSPIKFTTFASNNQQIFYSQAYTCSDDGTLDSGSCQISVRFSPQSVGVINGTITMPYTGGGGGTVVVNLTGTGTAGTPAINLNPLPINFGQLQVQTAATPITLQVENTGTAPLTGIAFTITGANAGDYTESDTCSGVTIDPYPGTGSCNVTLNFTPTGGGPRVATINVTSNSGAATFSTPLQGAGVSQPAQVQFTPSQLNLIAGAGGPCADATAGGKATAATLCNITGTTQDYLGNTYLVDNTYNVVYKMDMTGAISVFAGTPSKTGGYAGDNGPATSAALSGPTSVAADAFGDIFISDTANSAIREVDTTGMITSFVDSSCDEEGRGTPKHRNASTKAGKAHPHEVQLCETFQPEGLVVDALGNLIFADTLNNVVLETNINTGAFNFVAGDAESLTGTAGYNGDNIPADGAELNAPQDVAVDTAGNIYIADTLNYRVRMVTAASGIITTVAGNGTQGDTGDGSAATSAEINAYGVSADLAGDLFITPGTGGIVRKVDLMGNINLFAGGGTGAIGGPASTGAVTNAYFARVDNAGDLLIPTGTQLLAAGPDGLLQFGSEPVGSTSAPLTITLEDTGDNALALTNPDQFTATGDFTVTGGTCADQDTNFSIGESCTITVTFTPTASGARTGTISVPSNAVGNPATILLQGNGTAASAPSASLSPTALSFPSTSVGATAAVMSTTLSNTGNAVLNISGITLTGANTADFAIVTSATACGTTLAAGATCTISATFTPAAVTSYTASISVADNATGSPQTATLSGTGTAAAAPAASLSPTTLAFPSTTVGTTATAMSTTLSNTGNAVLNISGITLSGTNTADFTITASGTTCGTTLAAGSSCTIAVTFTPAAVATYAASISVADNATGSPQTATLSGSGTAAPAPIASLSPTTLAFPATTAGSTATALSTTLSNTGNAVLTITGITLTGANTADFAITTTGTTCGATLAAGSTCTIAATFTPAAAGNFTASISVADNAAGSPQTATLTGTGNAPLATDFTLTATPPAQTVAPGAVAQFTINTTGVGGDFDSAVQLTATGLPSGFTVAFAPSAVTPGANGASSVLSIQTTSQTALARPHPLHRTPSPWLATLLVIPLLGLRKRFSKLRVLTCLLLVGALAPVIMLTGCGGGYYNIEAKTYTVTVTGTSGSTQHSTTVTLTVQQ